MKAIDSRIIVLASWLMLCCNKGEAPAEQAQPEPGAVKSAVPAETGETKKQQPLKETAEKDEGEGEEKASVGFQLGAPSSLKVVAIRWRRLGRKHDVEALRIVPFGRERFALIVPQDAGAETAESLAGTLELEASTAREFEDKTALKPSLVKTTLSLNLHGEPSADSDWIRTLSPQTLAVALHGEVDGKISEAGGQGKWSYLVVTSNDQGWSASRYLEEYDGCLPLPTAMVSHNPQRATQIRRDVTFSVVNPRINNRKKDAFMLIARDPDEYKSYLGIYEKGENCELKSFYNSLDLHGFVQEAFITDAEKNRGPSLLIVGMQRRSEPDRTGKMLWQAYKLGRATAVWHILLNTGMNLEKKDRESIGGPVEESRDGRKAYFPVRIRRRTGTELLKWNGRTLVSE